jgi:hypothetical protein
MDIAGLMSNFEAHGDHWSPPMIIPFLGRFKGETGQRWHMLPIVWKIRSGIEAGTWASRLMESLLERNGRHGSVFVRMCYPDLFQPNVNIEDDYGIPRSCQR